MTSSKSKSDKKDHRSISCKSTQFNRFTKLRAKHNANTEKPVSIDGFLKMLLDQFEGK